MPETIDDKYLVETLLLASPSPIPFDDLLARLPMGVEVRKCLEQLRVDYEGRALQLVEVAGGWTTRTRPEHSDLCRDLLAKPLRMSKAPLETLAVIALFQPVTRPEIERIRGVSLAKGTLDLLIWAGLVRPGARRQTQGNPLTFLTTDAFLRMYSFNSLDDMPGLSEMREEGLLNAAPDIGMIPRAEEEQ